MADPIVDTTVQPETTPAGGESVESLKAQLEAEKAQRIIAEGEASNAKKDVIAIKTGRKREEIDLSKETPEAPKPETPVQPDNAAIMAELAESRRVMAELLRSVKPGMVMPSGGGGIAESPAPKPKGYWSDAQKSFLKAKGWSDQKIAIAEHTAQTSSSLGTKESKDYGISKRTY